jgi:hypothetical protein
MFNITGHSENGNQNHNEIPLYTHFNGSDGKAKTARKCEVLEKMQKNLHHSILLGVGECKKIESMWKMV